MKFITISLIVIGIIVIFNAGGIETPTGGLVYQFLDGGLATFKQSSFWTTLVTILTVGAAGTALAGLFGRAPPESFLIGALVFSLSGAVLTDMGSIFLILWNLDVTWIRWVATSVSLPLFIGYFATIISFWRGTDG